MNISSILIIITFGLFACQIISHQKNSRLLSESETSPSCANFPQNTSSRCIGCQQAKRGDFPWHVEVTDDGRKYLSCGGTLISQKIVLTSGMCVKEIDLKDLRIISGQRDKSKNEPGEMISEVLQIFFHPECCLKKLPNNNQTIPGANIALLELKEAVNISKFINIACIDGTKEPNNEATVITAGWGSTEECIREKNCEYPDILQTTEMQVVSREQCNKELVEAYPVLENSITEDYICAKDDDSGLCRGDIGGSLIQNINGKAFVVGIFSMILGKCPIRYPGVFTNVAYYLNWIKETMTTIETTTTPPPPTVPCENGKRYYGEELNIQSSENPEKCQEKCKIDNSCNYWTWTIYDWKLGEKNVCSKIKTMKWWNVKNAYSISGSKTCIISDIPPKAMEKFLKSIIIHTANAAHAGTDAYIKAHIYSKKDYHGYCQTWWLDSDGQNFERND